MRGAFKYAKDKDSGDVFTQSYSFVESFRPTTKIFINTSLKYNKLKKGVNHTEILTPTASLSLNNDIFRLNFSGTHTETVDTKKSDKESTAYNFNFSSFYKEIINTKAFFTRTTSRDKSSPRKLNVSSDSFGFTIQRYFFEKINVSYDFKTTINNDKVNKGKNVFRGDTFILNLTDISLNMKKFVFRLSSNFNYKRNIMKSKVSDQGFAKFPVNVNIEWKQAKEGYLSEEDEFIISLEEESVDALYFYSDSEYGTVVPNLIKWDIYWSKDKVSNDDDWDKIYSDVSLPFIFPETFMKKGYIKLVAVYVPEKEIFLDNPLMECFLLKYSTGTYAKYVTQSRDYRTDLSLKYNFNRNFVSEYRINYGRSIPDPGESSDSIYHTLSARLFFLNFSLSQNIKDNEKSSDSMTTSFTVTGSKKILETLSLSGAYTRSVNEENHERINSSHVISVSANANIYPDLTLRWGQSYNINKSYTGNTTSKTYSSNMALTARFTKKFTFNAGYRFNKNITPKSATNQNVTFNAAWRVSEILFMNGSENINLPDNGITEIAHSFTLWLALTDKIQFNFSYSGTRGSNKTDSYSNFVSWKIGKKLSTKFSYNQTVSKGENKWGYFISLNILF